MARTSPRPNAAKTRGRGAFHALLPLFLHSLRNSPRTCPARLALLHRASGWCVWVDGVVGRPLSGVVLFFGLTGLHGSHCWACRGYFGLLRLGWRSWARAVVGAVLAAPAAFRMGDRAIIPAKVVSNLQPHHKHTFTSRLRDAWGRGFLWRSSAVKREGHRASHACMRKLGGPPVSVRGLFEHRGNPCPFRLTFVPTTTP